MDEHQTPSQQPEGVDQNQPIDITEVTMLSYERDAFVEQVYHAWCQKFQQVPSVSIRGDVDFIEPSSKPGKWKKKRTVYLKEWHRVKEWQHDGLGRMLIDYTFIGSPSHRQQRTQEQWIRPTNLFDVWPDVQIRPDLTAKETPNAQE